MPRILGTGLVALDLIVQHRAGEQQLSASGGGTSANVTAILSRMGWNASWLGEIDHSRAGQVVRKDMHRAGVELHTVPGPKASPTAIFAHHIAHESDGSCRHWFSDRCPHCDRKLPSYRRPSDSWLGAQVRHAQQADVFFVDRLSSAALDLAHAARRHGALVVYEPSTASDAPWMDEMIELADIVKFSSDRCHALEGVTPTNREALWVETLGRDGLRWSLGSLEAHREHVPAVVNSKAIDACGAGDWLTSALLFGLARSGKPPSRMVRNELTQVLTVASHVAAWSVGYLGARGALYDAPVHSIFELLMQPASERTPAPSTIVRPKPTQTFYCAFA